VLAKCQRRHPCAGRINEGSWIEQKFAADSGHGRGWSDKLKNPNHAGAAASRATKSSDSQLAISVRGRCLFRPVLPCSSRPPRRHGRRGPPGQPQGFPEGDPTGHPSADKHELGAEKQHEHTLTKKPQLLEYVQDAWQCEKEVPTITQRQGRPTGQPRRTRTRTHTRSHDEATRTATRHNCDHARDRVGSQNATTIRDELCVRVEHHRTITIREATYARRFKRVCRKRRTWLWLVGLKKVSKPSRCMTTDHWRTRVFDKCQRRHPCAGRINEGSWNEQKFAADSGLGRGRSDILKNPDQAGAAASRATHSSDSQLAKSVRGRSQFRHVLTCSSRPPRRRRRCGPPGQPQGFPEGDPTGHPSADKHELGAAKRQRAHDNRKTTVNGVYTRCLAVRTGSTDDHAETRATDRATHENKDTNKHKVKRRGD